MKILRVAVAKRCSWKSLSGVDGAGASFCHEKGRKRGFWWCDEGSRSVGIGFDGKMVDAGKVEADDGLAEVDLFV